MTSKPNKTLFAPPLHDVSFSLTPRSTMSTAACEINFHKKNALFRFLITSHWLYMSWKICLKLVLDSRAEYFSRHIKVSPLKNWSDFGRLFFKIIPHNTSVCLLELPKVPKIDPFYSICSYKKPRGNTQSPQNCPKYSGQFKKNQTKVHYNLENVIENLNVRNQNWTTSTMSHIIQNIQTESDGSSL